VKDLVTVAIGLLAWHPAVTGVELAGSRSRGTHEELSDWDFAVETSDFDAVAHDLPTLVAPLDPLGEQWEPIGHFPVYQVLLRGPTKVEYLFLEHSQEPMPPLDPSADTLVAINTHSGTGSGGLPRRPPSVATISWPNTCPSSMRTSCSRWA
jgi:predicted nucleotidyltransferase